MADSEAPSGSHVGSDEDHWNASQEAFQKRIEAEIRGARAQGRDDVGSEISHQPQSIISPTSAGKERRSVRFSEPQEDPRAASPHGNEQFPGDEEDNESTGTGQLDPHLSIEHSFAEEEADFDDDFGDEGDDDIDEEDDAAAQEGVLSDDGTAPHLTQDLLRSLDISQLPNNILMQIAPPEIATEFEERIAHLDLDIHELREKLQASEREWKLRYRELEIQNGLKQTEMSTLRGDNQDLREKVSSYKRNLWVKSVDLETIKLVEDEVKEVMDTRDREMENLRAVKQEHIRAIKRHHEADLDEHTEAVNKQITEAMEAIVQKECLTTQPRENEELVHQSVADPLDILKTLSSINVSLHNSIFGGDAAGKQADLKAVLDDYRNRELELLRHHIGDVPSMELESRRERVEEEVEKLRLDRAELIEYTSEVSEMVAEVLEGASGLDTAAAAEPTPPRKAVEEGAVASDDGAASPEAAQAETTAEKAAKVHISALAAKEALVELAEKLKEYDGVQLRAEDIRMNSVSVDGINRDPLFAHALHDSKFAERLEAVLRENELLKARLHILGNTTKRPDDIAKLTETAEALEARCNLLNTQCNDLEDQKRKLKALRDDIQRDALQYAEETNASDARRKSLTDVGGSDSEVTASIDDSSTGEDDLFDPEHEMAMDQIAGVESLVEDPQQEDPRQYELEKKQFAATIRKESHVASLVEQILQYLESGTTVFRVKGMKIEKKFAFLTAQRSVILLCDFVEGKPNKKVGLEQLHLRHVRSIILGQNNWDKKIIKNTSNIRADPAELHLVPKDTESVEIYNTGQYYYRSITLKRRTGDSFNFMANTDNDYETWVVAMHRITTLDPQHDKILDVAKNMYPGVEVLDPAEKEFCEKNHVTPLLYLNAKMQCLKQEHKLFLTLYDVRTLSGFDLLQSQKVFELWLFQGWVEKQYVYQLRYLEEFPEEASNLMATIDLQRQRKLQEESERMLHHG